ncbi:unnamed protein product [Cochlearia groenlandica]
MHFRLWPDMIREDIHYGNQIRRTSIPELQLLQTPDKGAFRDDIQVISADSKTHGKGSQIRKSLRTIGKLINGSEKRYDNTLCLF